MIDYSKNIELHLEFLMRKLILRIHEKKLVLNLKETETASMIYNAVPISSSINTWGEEIYFSTREKIRYVGTKNKRRRNNRNRFYK